MPEDTCLVCGTPIHYRQDAGWTHDLGYRETGCRLPVPTNHADLPPAS